METCKGTGFFNFRILNLNNRMWTCGPYEMMIVNFVGFQNFPFLRVRLCVHWQAHVGCYEVLLGRLTRKENGLTLGKCLKKKISINAFFFFSIKEDL